MCAEHKGKEVLNRTFNLSVSHIFNCLFTDSEFNSKLIKSSKYLNMKCEDWSVKSESNMETRKQEYSINLGSLGTAKNFVEQVSSIGS